MYPSIRFAAAAACLVVAVYTLAARAQSSSASFQIPRSGIDGGATQASSARFQLRATLAQADAAVPMSGPRFRLQGGFHRSSFDDASSDVVFADGFESASP